MSDAPVEAPPAAAPEDAPVSSGAGDDTLPEPSPVAEDDGYKVSKPVTVEELLEKDKDDESLKRYKESLLGAAAAAAVADDGDPRNVIIDSISIVVKDRPDIVIPLSTPADVAAVKGRNLKFKEGVEYFARFRFRVRRQIVTGLKFVQVVYKLKLPVEDIEYMMGSYAPRPEPYEFVSPVDEWPSGFLIRGHYVTSVKFTDDDKNVHLAAQYEFDIAKEWPAGPQ